MTPPTNNYIPICENVVEGLGRKKIRTIISRLTNESIDMSYLTHPFDISIDKFIQIFSNKYNVVALGEGALN